MNKSQISALSIYELARSIYPLFNVGDVFADEHRTLMDLRDTDTQDLASTNAANGLKLFLKLPTEIRTMISAVSRPSLMSSLQTVRDISRSLLKHPPDVRLLLLPAFQRLLSSLFIVRRMPPGAAKRLLRRIAEHNTIISSLSTAQTTIFGRQYISSVAFNKPEGISVRTTDFRGIRFTIGRYGLRALSILYADGSTSAWHGDPKNGWMGILYGDDIRDLHVLEDVSPLVCVCVVANGR